MGIGGRRPKSPGQAVTRTPRVYGWTEVENTRTPRVRGCRRAAATASRGRPMYAHAGGCGRRCHSELRQPSDWEFAADTAELLARAAEAGGGSVALWKEIRVRERVWAQPSMRGCRSGCGMSHRRWMGRPHRSRGRMPTAICDQCAARRCRPVGQRHERDRTSEELETCGHHGGLRWQRSLWP
jgi:hypothetical protein